MPFGMTCKEFEAADWRALEDSFTFALGNSFSKEAEGDWRASENSLLHKAQSVVEWHCALAAAVAAASVGGYVLCILIACG